TRSKRDWSSDVCSSDLSVVYSRIPFYAVHPAVLAGFAVLAAGVLWLGRTLFLRLPALSPRMEWAIGGGALAVWWCVQLAAAWCSSEERRGGSGRRTRRS